MKENSTYPFKKILWLYLAWWIFLALLQTFVLHRLSVSWCVSLVDAFISTGLLALACFSVIIIYRYYQPGKSNRSYHFVFTLGITILYTLAIRWILPFVLHSDTEYVEFLEKSMPVRFIFSFLVLSFITVLNWVWGHLHEQTEKEKRNSDTEQLVKDAELAKLRQQLQPHFLFNSLNSISALAGSKPNEARKMIQQLSDFLRGTLKKDEQKTVPLQEELEHIKLYLDIERVRFGHRLQINMNVEPDSILMQIPPLLMQPIVENAIKFGLYDTIDDITIDIHTFIKDGYLCVQVKNPFDVQTHRTIKGTGFGLSSIQRRLFLLYARNDLMTTEAQDNIFITTLKIPQSK